MIDPQITFCSFFVSPHRFEDAQAAVVLGKLFVDVMSELGERPYPRIVFPEIVDTKSRRLGNAVVRQADGYEISAEIRTLHDTVSLRSQTLQVGRDVAPADFRALPDPCPPSLTGVKLPNYLGTLKLYSAESAAGAPAEQLRQMADDIAAVVWNQPPLTCVETDTGVLILGLLDTQSEAIFVYREQTDVTETLLLTIPEMILCHLKIRNAAHNLSTHLPAAKRHDFELRALIDPEHPRPRKLRALWKANVDITNQRSHLARCIANLEAEIRSLKLNRKNFAAVVGASPFAAARIALAELMIDRWSAPLVTQATADLGYRIATRERAAVQFESIDTTINWYDARLSLWLTIIVLALTIVQVVAALPVIWQMFCGGI